jgi:hypothetical protein
MGMVEAVFGWAAQSIIFFLNGTLAGAIQELER